MKSEPSFVAKALETLWKSRAELDPNLVRDAQEISLGMGWLADLSSAGHLALPWQARRELWESTRNGPVPDFLAAMRPPSWVSTLSVPGGPLTSLTGAEGFPLIAFSGLAALEKETAEILLTMASRGASRADREKGIDSSAPGWDSLGAEQKLATGAALDAGVFILTGGPGTGKTTTLFQILIQKFLAAPGLRVALATPTGRASARLRESLKANLTAARAAAPNPAPRLEAAMKAVEACRPVTVHRLIGLREGFRPPLRGPEFRLPFDLVVVDEASMLDLLLAHDLVLALNPASSLILAGDPYQLPSVDAGALLLPLLASGKFLSTELKQNHRLESDSSGRTERLEALFQAVRSGDPSYRRDEFARPWLKEAFRTSQAVEALFDFLGGDLRPGSRDPAILRKAVLLTPYRGGSLGVETLNAAMARRLGHEPDRPYPGLPWLIRRNLDDLGLFNGDRGLVDYRNGTWIVLLPTEEGLRTLPFAFLAQDGEASWAMTVHKSQGSEFDGVVYVLQPPPDDETGFRPSRETLYTALTRTRKNLMILADDADWNLALTNPTTRCGLLQTFLTE